MSDVKKIATRDSYGNALAELGTEHKDVVVLDADLAAATKTGVFKKAHPERFIDCGIAESNMMGVAAGLAAAGLDGLTADSFDKLNELLAKAKAMPKNTKVEKEERSAAITSAKNRIYSKKIIEEKHGGHIEEFDTSVFESLFEKEDANLEQRKKLEEEISAAKKEKAAVKLASLKEKRKALKEEKKKIDAEIKKATDENSYYNKLAKPYIDAVKLVKQAENYTHYEDIKNLYDEAKVRADEAARLAEEKEEALREEQKAMKERLKAEKAQKKSEKKLERNSKKSDGKNNSKK